MSFEEIGGEGAHKVSTIAETDPAAVDAQIAEGVARDGAAKFLNNFTAKLPGGMYRRPGLVGDLYAARLDEPMANPAIDEGLVRGERAHAVTWRAFFADMDTAVAAAIAAGEIDESELAARLTVRFSDQDYEDFAKYVLPVYRRLRLLGYSHGDLYT